EGPVFDLGAASGVSGTVSDDVAALDASQPAADEPMKLPSVTASATTPQIDGTRDYPSTPSQFSLPDPNDAAATLASADPGRAGDAATASASGQPLEVRPAAASINKSDSAPAPA